jgi:hypothetical protein
MKEHVNKLALIAQDLNLTKTLKDLEIKYKDLTNQELGQEEKTSKYSALEELFALELAKLTNKTKEQNIDIADMVDAFMTLPDLKKAFSAEGLSHICMTRYPEISANIHAHSFLQEISPSNVNQSVNDDTIGKFANILGAQLSGVAHGKDENAIKVARQGISIVYSKLPDKQLDSLIEKLDIWDFSAEGLALNSSIIENLEPKNSKLTLMNLELKQQYLENFESYIENFTRAHSYDARDVNYDEDDSCDLQQVKKDAIALFVPLTNQKTLLNSIEHDIDKILNVFSNDHSDQARQALAIEIDMKFNALKPELKDQLAIDKALDGEDKIGTLQSLKDQYLYLLNNQNALFPAGQDNQQAQSAKMQFDNARKGLEVKIGKSLGDVLEKLDQNIEVFQLAERIINRKDVAELLFENQTFLAACKEQSPILVANIDAAKILHICNSNNSPEAFEGHLMNISQALEYDMLQDSWHAELLGSIVYARLNDEQIDDLCIHLQQEVRNKEVADRFLTFNNRAINNAQPQNDALILMQTQLKQAYSEVLPQMLSDLVKRNKEGDVNFGVEKPYLSIPLDQNNLQEVVDYAAKLFAPLEADERRLRDIKSDLTKAVNDYTLNKDDSLELRKDLGAQFKKISKKYNAMDRVYAKLDPGQIKDLGAKFVEGVHNGDLSYKLVGGLKSSLKKIPGKNPHLLQIQASVTEAYEQKLPFLLEDIVQNELEIPLRKQNLAKVKTKVRNLLIPTTDNKDQLDRITNAVEKIIVTEAKEFDKDNGVERDIKRGITTKVKRYCQKKFTNFMSKVSSVRSDKQIVPTSTKFSLQDRIRQRCQSV